MGLLLVSTDMVKMELLVVNVLLIVLIVPLLLLVLNVCQVTTSLKISNLVENVLKDVLIVILNAPEVVKNVSILKNNHQIVLVLPELLGTKLPKNVMQLPLKLPPQLPLQLPQPPPLPISLNLPPLF